MESLKTELDKCDLLCFNCHNKKHYKEENVDCYKHLRKNEAIEYKGGKCIKCGFNECPGSLHFHHHDKDGKEFNISFGGKAFENIKNELDKCELLCGNCHHEVHYDESQIVFEQLKKDLKEMQKLYPSPVREEGKVKMNCEFCKKEIVRFKSTLPRAKRIYCSMKCKYDGFSSPGTLEQIEELLKTHNKTEVSKILGVSVKIINKRLRKKNK